MILKEHYINFIKRHLANFSRKTIKNEIKENRYFFCSRGRVIYSFKNFVQLIEEELKLKGKRKNDLRGYLIKRLPRSRGLTPRFNLLGGLAPATFLWRLRVASVYRSL